MTSDSRASKALQVKAIFITLVKVIQTLSGCFSAFSCLISLQAMLCETLFYKVISHVHLVLLSKSTSMVYSGAVMEFALSL